MAQAPDPTAHLGWSDLLVPFMMSSTGTPRPIPTSLLARIPIQLRVSPVVVKDDQRGCWVVILSENVFACLSGISHDPIQRDIMMPLFLGA
ncbi:hypothetical protein F5Y09DRAFT_308522 [Xylaria sp. FL1042]|nr:hypothetical protein F5Y09DRAFT_308522 [Xylaria sp. FL1042]